MHQPILVDATLILQSFRALDREYRSVYLLAKRVIGLVIISNDEWNSTKYLI